jgi:deazaflavin-dependent oxidoreductase (nitroreductase family)
MTQPAASAPFLPPRWFIHVAWQVHRGIVRFSGGHLGLWLPKPGKWGALRLTTVGRRTGRERTVIIAYLEDGPTLFGLAMNGWGAPEPAWWLNLQAHPDATVECKDGRRDVRARAAAGDERTRLWARLKETDAKLDEFAAMRPTPTAVVVLETR